MKLKPEFETECYLTDGGYYLIKQPNQLDRNQEDVIMLTRAQVEKVVKDMQSCMDIVDEWGAKEE